MMMMMMMIMIVIIVNDNDSDNDEDDDSINKLIIRLLSLFFYTFGDLKRQFFLHKISNYFLYFFIFLLGF